MRGLRQHHVRQWRDGLSTETRFDNAGRAVTPLGFEQEIDVEPIAKIRGDTSS